MAGGGSFLCWEKVWRQRSRNTSNAAHALLLKLTVDSKVPCSILFDMISSNLISFSSMFVTCGFHTISFAISLGFPDGKFYYCDHFRLNAVTEV